MNRNTITCILPAAMCAYIDERVHAGDYANPSEYVHELIRRDHEQQAATRLGSLITEGVESGPGRLLDDEYKQQLAATAIGDVDL